MRRYFDEAWNHGRSDILDDLISPNYVNHNPALPGLPPGPQGLKPVFVAFPDINYTVEDQVIATGKTVTISTTTTANCPVTGPLAIGPAVAELLRLIWVLRIARTGTAQKGRLGSGEARCYDFGQPIDPATSSGVRASTGSQPLTQGRDLPGRRSRFLLTGVH
jgi:hypothetical protein